MKHLFLVAALLLSLPSMAEISVIVHPSNQAKIESTDIARMFLGKMKSFPNGGIVLPINLAEGTAPRKAFDKTVLKKSSSQIKAYWSKLVFTGKGSPPREVSNDTEMLELIKANPSLIGYVSSGSITSDVKVIATF
ncbi:phosphate ABC transporter substrate-binding protein [Psychrosphaera sp. B3R10]|uniref:phosphate ABC transporter substrate-binding protein n=1 Tax=unclassified Psychrosphaera TaxID=2641570 RepID=UPI001C0A2486|nr:MULTISPECIES: phosphate ABC transporter substrate-binding protein [unclassified Psychrosphaera]MBU2881487.1 phosphate ABC transporter substrate-binding protein [Psychrosphaera sp. I2R16]MBU2989501.1 phosphate ABC transporter substrate-binding protein [Psychrosphaera sp. B3R10]